MEAYPMSGEKQKGGDHFIVEELLDFSNEEEEEEDDVNAADEGDNGGDHGGFEVLAGNSTDSSGVTADVSCNSSFDASLSGQLCEAYDDLAELEWLSNFVEESFSSEDLQKLQVISGVKSAGLGSSLSEAREPENSSSDGGKLTASAVPGKARTKRARPAPCNWSFNLLVLGPNTVTASSSSDSDSILLYPNPVRKAPKPAKKKEPGLLATSDGRRCLHCATDKTPQWRTGPMGPKTLCNACGVRYKSGRLVPEYRPAASPTFMLSEHSNSHRKVLELRRLKEMHEQFGGGVYDGMRIS